jgi:hypothetical protein
MACGFNGWYLLPVARLGMKSANCNTFGRIFLIPAMAFGILAADDWLQLEVMGQTLYHHQSGEILIYVRGIYANL